MPRIPRSFVKTTYFHVMTQGINREYIFNKAEDIKYYIKRMYSLKEKYDIEILAYCIMNNHAHILIKVDAIENMGKFMLCLNSKYAAYYNKKNARVGYVFRDRYKAEGIYSEEHLYNCIRYIYNNPVKAGICAKPEYYKYSNYITSAYFNKIEEGDDYVFLDTDEDIERISRQEVIKYLEEVNVKFEELKSNKTIMKEVIKILNVNYGFSQRKISKIINIGRETVRKTISCQ